MTIAVLAVPFPAEWLAPATVESRRVFDRHGVLLREALNDAEGRGAWRGLEQISPWVPRAFVAIEDHRFAHHLGVDPRGVARAAWQNLRAGRVVAGGSTITQQVAGLIVDSPRTLWGKLVEAVWALRLERALDKHGVLEQYVNRVPFGHGSFGIEAASRLYLDKPASALSLAEAALLAGIPRAPSVNNPFTDRARAEARQATVLRRMHATGAIDAEQLAEALAQPLRLAARGQRFAAPHFTSWALSRETRPGDLRTTLDGPLQVEVEALAGEVVAELSDQAVSQAAVIVLDNASGDVLAWVGSADFFAPRDGQVDMVVGRRQPGSTLKPFVYGLGIERGLTAADRLPDLPLFFPTGLGDYRPRNYDRRFHGWVSLRTALANSYNVPAVWLAHRVGPSDILVRLRALGLQSLTRTADHYGLGLALGNGEVQLIELANAYRALANDGIWSPVRWRAGQPRAAGQQIMPVAVARLLTDILADPVARLPAFGRFNALALPFPAAAKTGTSTDFTDNWTVGYTPAVTVGVWVGNFDGRPMEGVSGVTGAGRLWHRVMRRVTPAGAPRAFDTTGLARVRLCQETGQPYTDDCAHGIDELFLPDRVPQLSRPATPPARLRITFPGAGDVFQRDPDTPDAFSRVRLRAEAPVATDRLVWEINGQRVGETRGRADESAARGGHSHARWWQPTPGVHRVRVWPAGRPGAATPVVAFTVTD